MQTVNKISSDCWYGYTPSKFRDGGGSITNLSMPAMPNDGAEIVPEDVALHIAEVVSDHDLLQARIKSEVSQALQDHNFETSPKEATPDELECVFDVAEDKAQEEIFLLEFLDKSNEDEESHVSEGLILILAQDRASYTRVGFFVASSKRLLFTESDTTDIELE